MTLTRNVSTHWTSAFLSVVSPKFVAFLKGCFKLHISKGVLEPVFKMIIAHQNARWQTHIFCHGVTIPVCYGETPALFAE